MEDKNSQGFVTVGKVIPMEAGGIRSLSGGEMDTPEHLVRKEIGLGGFVG